MCVNRRLEKKAVRIGMLDAAEGSLTALERLVREGEMVAADHDSLAIGVGRIEMLRRALGARDCSAVGFDRLGLDTKRWVRRVARALDDAAVEDGLTLAEIAHFFRVGFHKRETAGRLIPFCKTWLEVARE